SRESGRKTAGAVNPSGNRQLPHAESHVVQSFLSSAVSFTRAGFMSCVGFAKCRIHQVPVLGMLSQGS
ncbi:MAG: hypothetical protein Q9M48_15345, partial [Rhodobacterales bacterium]|nr:hypothetical protein [Rhodobacterales bacterium]